MQPNGCLFNISRNGERHLPRGFGLTAKLVGAVVAVSASLLLLLAWAARLA